MIFVFAVVFAALVFAWIPPVVWLGVAIYGAGSVLVIMGGGLIITLLESGWSALDARLQARGVAWVYRACGALGYTVTVIALLLALAIVLG